MSEILKEFVDCEWFSDAFRGTKPDARFSFCVGPIFYATIATFINSIGNFVAAKCAFHREMRFKSARSEWTVDPKGQYMKNVGRQELVEVNQGMDSPQTGR
jgi:hypothetical protein